MTLEDEFQERLSQSLADPDELSAETLKTMRYFFFGGALAAIDRVSNRPDPQAAVDAMNAEIENLMALMDRGEL